MDRLSLDELSLESDAFDKAVDATHDIDHFCSSSDWVIPAARALMPAREAWICKEGTSYWAFMRAQHPEGFHYLEPLEAMWALASPLLGSDDKELVEGLRWYCQLPLATWSLLALPGLDTAHRLFAAIVEALAPTYKLALGMSSMRLVVDLEQGAEVFLARRSPNFRRALRRSQSHAKGAGITFEDASKLDASALFQRIMAVEARSWKGLEGAGITEGGMHDFYRLMLPRLSAQGRARVLFARSEDRDLAYIFGGIRCGSYRGLQFSYDADAREYGLGNLLQFEQITRLCREGVATYDLGMHMDYKLRWADRIRETTTLLIVRS